MLPNGFVVMKQHQQGKRLNQEELQKFDTAISTPPENGFSSNERLLPIHSLDDEEALTGSCDENKEAKCAESQTAPECTHEAHVHCLLHKLASMHQHAFGPFLRLM